MSRLKRIALRGVLALLAIVVATGSLWGHNELTHTYSRPEGFQQRLGISR